MIRVRITVRMKVNLIPQSIVSIPIKNTSIAANSVVTPKSSFLNAEKVCTTHIKRKVDINPRSMNICQPNCTSSKLVNAPIMEIRANERNPQK